MYDKLFRNGLIIDGTGSPAYLSDVAVSADRIAAVEGHIPPEEAEAVFDISGKYLCPGIIDLHTHSDFPLLADSRALSAVYQGVTTQVIGNCGFGPAPLKHADDIRRNVFCYRGDFDPQWRGFPDFLDFLSARSAGTNVVSLVGHAALRSSVLGYEGRVATAEELKAMDRLLREALEAGAFGLSTGLEYAPGINAGSDEIRALCAGVAAFGGLYTTHVRNRDENYREGFGEAFRTAYETGVRLQISHAVPKYGAPVDAVGWFLDELHAAAQRSDIAADVIPYEWGPTGLVALLPGDLLSYGASKIAEMLESTSVRKRIMSQEKPFWLHFRDGLWDQVMLYHSERLPHLVGKNAYELGEYFHTDPFDALLSVLQEEGESMFSTLMMGKIKSRAHLDLLIQDRCVGVISDAMSLATDGPLAGMIWSPGCYGWVPHYMKEFVGAGRLLSLEKGIEKITGFPAARLGLSDRGVIRPGAQADICVFDFDRIREKASMRQPAEYAEGFSYVMCNGEFTVKEGVVAANLPGRLLRRG